MNSKYNNVLTILLVVAIVGIVGVLIFLGYDWYRKQHIEKETEEIMQRFEQSLENSENNTTTDENINASEFDVNILGNSSFLGGGSSSATPKKTKYQGFTVEGTIEIPKISLKYPVLNGVTSKSLKTSVALFCGPGLNEVGNTVIMGHNYRNGTFFSNVKKLVANDLIYITDYTGRKLQYKVTKIYTTSGSDSSYIERDTKGKREITLSTCTDDGSGVILVWAVES